MKTKFARLIVAIELAVFALVMLNSPAVLLANDGSTSSRRNSQPVSRPSTVKSVSNQRIQAISDKIDSLVENKLHSSGEKLNRLTSDEVFLRRAYLDIIGRIATVNEAKRFLKSKSKTKRADLIDELLDSYGYVSRQYNFWADILRIRSQLPGQLTGVSYIDFVKDALEENKAYDKFVHELLNASGANLERGNGAVGYYLRDRNMPEDNMSNTVRVFLGTRLECAQCHDHPFDKWTQREYFEMVAFTGGLGYRNPEANSALGDLRRLIRKGEVSLKNQGIANRVAQIAGHGISGSGTGLARLPEGFLGDDGYEGEIVTGKTIFDRKKLVDSAVPEVKKNKKTRKPKPGRQQGSIFGAKPLNSRQAYADWMTDPTNPRFATVVANRLWKQAMGVGLIEPVDIIEDGTVASNPELMEYLRETMVALNFDMKQFLRAIYNSKTYQAAAFDQDVSDPTKFNFNGPIVRRMSAEQIWDSLLVLSVSDVDRRNHAGAARNRYGAILGESPYESYEKINSMNLEQLKNLVAQLDAGKNKANKKSSYKDKDNPAFRAMAVQKKIINKELTAAREAKDFEKQRELMIELAKLTNKFRTNRSKSAYLRASEMQSPAPAGHFLRQFGQSDREAIENANTEPAVPQVLSMMNGYVEEKIARDPTSVLMQTVLTAENKEECTELVFLAMLNREPTSSEARSWKRDFAKAMKVGRGKVKEVYSDLIWTLANSNEFVFVK